MRFEFTHKWHMQDWQDGHMDGDVYIVNNRGSAESWEMDRYKKMYHALAAKIQSPFPELYPQFYIVPGFGGTKTAVHILLEAEVIPVVVVWEVPDSTYEDDAIATACAMELAEIREILGWLREDRVFKPVHRQTGCTLCIHASKHLQWIGHNKFLNTWKYKGPTKWVIQREDALSTLAEIFTAFNEWAAIVNTQGVSDLMCMEAELHDGHDKHI